MSLQHIAQRLGRRPTVARISSRVMPPLDRIVHRLTRGRTTLSTLLFPTLMLTTTGRRSGLPRRQPLLYVRDGEAFVVVGSNFGQAAHPAWSANLLADPHAVVEVLGRRVEVRARLLDAEAKQRLWPQLVRVWPGFDDYVQRSGRDIRVFALEPLRG